MNPATLGGIAAVITAIAALVVALRDKPHEDSAIKVNTQVLPHQTTNGANSPAISGVGGNVTVNIGQARQAETSTAGVAPTTIGYGSRVGMNVTVRKVTGVNSTHAVLAAEHTEENAAEFCRDYSYTAKETCIRDALSQSLSKIVTANCDTGVFTTFYRRTLRFEGKARRQSVLDGPEYKIYDLDDQRYLDGSMASGLDVGMEVFRALCPKAVRLGEIAFKYPVKQ